MIGLIQIWRGRRYLEDWPYVYRWWTCGISWHHVKLGPIAALWYRWSDGRIRLEVSVLCGLVNLTVPGLDK